MKKLKNVKKRTDMIDELEEISTNSCFEYGVSLIRHKHGRKKYSIINAPNLELIGSKCAKYVEFLISTELELVFKITSYSKILYFGLGNESITADALGGKIVKKLFISNGLDFEHETASICPSVQAKTGFETSDIVKALVDQFQPELVIFFDTLASSSIERLGNSFQINSDGIAVGSGVGSFNKHIDKNYLGCDVVVIGVPFMIYSDKIAKNIGIKNKEVLKDLVLTPKNIDLGVNVCSEIIANSVNSVLFPELTLDEIKNIMCN